MQSPAGTAVYAIQAVLAFCIAWRHVLCASGRPSFGSRLKHERPSWFQRAAWIAYTAVPAGLCIAVTAFISTDLAAAPFLWVVPLSLYLLTFVAVFS